MGWDHHNHNIDADFHNFNDDIDADFPDFPGDIDQQKAVIAGADDDDNNNHVNDEDDDESGDHCDIISYGATREDEEDSVSISSRFLINITAIIAINTVINKIILMNMLKPLCCIITLIITITGEMLTIRQSFGADDRAELTITTI